MAVEDLAVRQGGQTIEVSNDPVDADGVGCGILLIGAKIFGVHQCTTANEPTLEEIEAETEEILANREKGVHCLSGWDGANRSLVRQVKAGLRDPDSFEHIEATITPVNPDTKKHGVSMPFLSRSGFGGMVVGRALGEVHSTPQ